MKLRRVGRRGQAIGVALEAGRITAVLRDESWSRALQPAEAGTGWADLRAALGELRARFPAGQATLRMALLYPLVQAKRVELPRLSPDDLVRVLGRDAERYFVGPAEPRVVSASACDRSRRSPVRYLVAATPAGLLDAIHRAADAAGCSVESVVPAAAAWCAAGLRYWPVLRQQGCSLVIPAEDGVEVLRLNGGRLGLVRRFRSADSGRLLPALAEPGAAEPPTVAVLGASSKRQVLAEWLAHQGIRVLDPPISRAGQDSPEVIAARFAGHTGGIELVPQAVRDERGRRSTRLATRLLAAAACLATLAAGLELWGQHRELDALRRQRALIRSSVAEAMRVRAELDGLDSRIRVLASAEAGASRWATALTFLAERIPPSAHLTQLRAEADSLVVEGVGKRAAAVFESVAKGPEFEAVRAAAPIRQEASDSGPAIERFTLAARLASLPAPGPER